MIINVQLDKNLIIEDVLKSDVIIEDNINNEIARVLSYDPKTGIAKCEIIKKDDN